MKFIQKKTSIVIVVILCLSVWAVASLKDDHLDSKIVLQGCDMLNHGISSLHLIPGREEYYPFSKQTGGRISFNEYLQNESMVNHALLEVDYYVVNRKTTNHSSTSAMLDSLFSVEFSLDYKEMADNSFELLAIEIRPKNKAELTSLSEITITTEPLKVKKYGEPITGILKMKMENGNWGIIYFFEWKYEIIVDEYNPISLKLLGLPEELDKHERQQ